MRMQERRISGRLSGVSTRPYQRTHPSRKRRCSKACDAEPRRRCSHWRGMSDTIASTGTDELVSDVHGGLSASIPGSAHWPPTAPLTAMSSRVGWV